MARYQLNRQKFLDEQELIQLHRTIQWLRQQNLRDSLLLGLALWTGARAQEILNLRWMDWDKQLQVVHIRGLKGSDDREIPIPEWLNQDLMLWHQKAQPAPEDLIFPITYFRLVQIWKKWRPVAKKFHALRHTFALELYKRYRDVRLVQVALGHRNINNTMIYAQYTFQTQELRKLFNGLYGPGSGANSQRSNLVNSSGLQYAWNHDGSGVAQLVEQAAVNRWVGGSKPSS